MSEDLSRLNPDQLYHALTEAGNDYADKDSAASLLEHTRKSVRASLANGCEEKAVAAKELFAEAHPDYMNHVKMMTDARRDALKAKVKYHGIQTWIELKRSIEAKKTIGSTSTKTVKKQITSAKRFLSSKR